MSALIALIVTILVELTVAVLFGYRKKPEVETVVLINLITNPLLNYFLYVINYFGIIIINSMELIFLEIIIVLVEWLLLRFALRQDPKKLLILSLAINLGSYLVGVLIFK